MSARALMRGSYPRHQRSGEAVPPIPMDRAHAPAADEAIHRVQEPGRELPTPRQLPHPLQGHALENFVLITEEDSRAQGRA
eukprot:7431702-Pyramimonas_sp.AAC.1